MRGTPDDHWQEDDCAFYRVVKSRRHQDVHWREPIDGQAIYGSPFLGDRIESSLQGRSRRDAGLEVPVRNGLRDLKTAIREVRPGDRVRVNDGGWMEFVKSEGEGFVAVLENGSVERMVQPSNPLDRPPGTFDVPWMRRADDHSSEGAVECLEVDWSEDEHWHPWR